MDFSSLSTLKHYQQSFRTKVSAPFGVVCELYIFPCSCPFQILNGQNTLRNNDHLCCSLYISIASVVGDKISATCHTNWSRYSVGTLDVSLVHLLKYDFSCLKCLLFCHISHLIPQYINCMNHKYDSVVYCINLYSSFSLSLT